MFQPKKLVHRSTNLQITGINLSSELSYGEPHKLTKNQIKLTDGNVTLSKPVFETDYKR